MKTQQLKRLINQTPNNYSNEILRLFREINTFKIQHPNITQFKESYFTTSDDFVIVTELAESDLKTYREQNPEISNEQIVEIMVQILNGLHYSHIQNLTHRDLSPDNVLVYENNTKFKLCDFGVASFGEVN